MTGGIPAFDKTNGKPSDVCLIVEGCYPHIAGGVSTWVDWLIKSQPDVSFRVISIVAPGEERKARYAFPPNVVAFREVVLGQAPARASRSADGLRLWWARRASIALNGSNWPIVCAVSFCQAGLMTCKPSSISCGARRSSSPTSFTTGTRSILSAQPTRGSCPMGFLRISSGLGTR